MHGSCEVGGVTRHGSADHVDFHIGALIGPRILKATLGYQYATVSLASSWLKAMLR